jgi:hypothetical protein
VNPKLTIPTIGSICSQRSGGDGIDDVASARAVQRVTESLDAVATARAFVETLVEI